MLFSSRSLFRWSCLLAFFLAVGAGTSVMAGTVEVTCVSADGSSLRGIQVTLQSLPSGVTEAKKSGRNGVAEFKPAPGIYRVWGVHPGHVPAYYEFIDVESEESTASVTLTFTPGDDQTLLPFQDAAVAQRSNELLMEGIQAAQGGDSETALEKVQEAIKTNPSNVDAPYNLAVLHLQSGRLDDAEKALQQSRDLLQVFVKIYAGQPAVEQLQQRLDTVNELLETMPVQRIGAQADAALKAKDYETAIAKYTEMTQLEPGNPVIHYNLALALTHANQLDQAKASIAKALELKPDDLGFQRLRDQISDIEKQGISLRASEAIKETQELLEKKEYQAALERIQTALADVPEELQSGSWLLIARAHAGLNHADEAIQAYRKSSELDAAQRMSGGEESGEDKRAGIDRELANFLFERERYPEGIDVYIQALKKEDAPLTSQLNQLGQTFSRQGKNHAAAAVYEKIVEVDPQYSEAYYELGMYHFYDTEQRDKAKTLLEKFVGLGGDQGKIDNAKAVLAVMKSKQ